MRLIRLMIAICAILSVSVFAYAHPGKTDSNGGHINHSTGEYHYHHGYSAHQHYDSNGDGILDCQYDFVVQTRSDNGSKTDTHIAKLYPDEKPVEEEPKVTSKENPKKKRTVENYILIFCLVFIGFCTLVDAIKCGVDEIRRKLKK